MSVKLGVDDVGIGAVCASRGSQDYAQPLDVANDTDANLKNCESGQKVDTENVRYVVEEADPSLLMDSAEMSYLALIPTMLADDDYLSYGAFSASQTLISWQKGMLLALLAMTVVGTYFYLDLTAIIYVYISHVLYLSLIVSKTFLLVKGCRESKKLKQTVRHYDDGYRDVEEYNDDLPSYSIMLPMYKEEVSVLDNIMQNIANICYPLDKLQILLVIERDDVQCMQKIQQTRLPDNFSVIIVPDTQPKTKAKACNYALRYVRGEFFTIFDADDKPDAKQLLKAVRAFREKPEISCLQSRLCYYNGNENLLTKMFDIEYRLLFSCILPAIVSMNGPVPLGGSSNHFRTQALRNVGGWDDYNVTEDAELGIRMAFRGMKVDVLESYTEEESPITLLAWLKQRARWNKGHLLTYLVYMRDPAKMLRHLGKVGFMVFSYAVGMPQIALLFSLCFFAYILIHFGIALEYEHVNCWVLWASDVMSVLDLVAGWIVLFFSAWITLNTGESLWQKMWLSFCFCCYFVLHVIAAWFALFELIARPYHWNKTRHGVSAYFKT